MRLLFWGHATNLYVYLRVMTALHSLREQLYRVFCGSCGGLQKSDIMWNEEHVVG